MGHRRRSKTRKGQTLRARAPRHAFVGVRGALALSAVVIAIALLAAALLLRDPSSGGGPPSGKTAAIIDQLNLTVPNQAFSTSVRETLESAGYTVDYYSGDEITVDFYRDLPRGDYDLLVMRVHAGLVEREGATLLGPGTGLYTNEPYDPAKYQDEQADGEVIKASYYGEANKLFGVMPKFIESSMQGRFNGATVVLMGCDGLKTSRTGEAFLAKGADAFVSWSDVVTASHTDVTTEYLLKQILVQGVSTADAVRITAAEVGPDPYSGAELRVLTSGG